MNLRSSRVKKRPWAFLFFHIVKAFDRMNGTRKKSKGYRTGNNTKQDHAKSQHKEILEQYDKFVKSR